jgi:putative iron-dependent peroxidase
VRITISSSSSGLARAMRMFRGLRGLREPSVTVGGANIVVGFGPACRERLAPAHTPVELRDFETITGSAGSQAPATQRDLWVRTHGTGTDLVVDTARAVERCLRPVAELALEQPGFVYRDSRDLTGFIDGTENPPVEEGPEVALVPDERKPSTAHIARVVIEENGEELEIYRRSVPYGRVGELGLYFVAFSAEPHRFDMMLARMFGTDGDGLHDRLTDFSRPMSGSYWFVPSLDALAEVMGGPRD